MRICAVNTTQPNYLKANGMQNRAKTNHNEPIQTQSPQENVSFKGGTGGALGILIGGAVGALTAAAIVATGGLAGVVAAVGYSGTIGAGAASCTHIGGIIGSIVEDNNKKS